MGAREGGSYTADKAGTETLVERTALPEPPPVLPDDAPDVPSAPAPEPIADAGEASPFAAPAADKTQE